MAFLKSMGIENPFKRQQPTIVYSAAPLGMPTKQTSGGGNGKMGFFKNIMKMFGGR